MSAGYERRRSALTPRHEVDAFHPSLGTAVEVEAGRDTQGNAIYRDLIQTSLLIDARFLALAVLIEYRFRSSGKMVASPDYRKTISVLDAIYASDGLRLPLEGGPAAEPHSSHVNQQPGAGHDTDGYVLAAQPGESQGRPKTTSSSQLIVFGGLPCHAPPEKPRDRPIDSRPDPGRLPPPVSWLDNAMPKPGWRPTRPSWSTAGNNAASSTPNMPRSPGSPSTTPNACTKPSATSRPPSTKPSIPALPRSATRCGDLTACEHGAQVITLPDPPVSNSTLPGGRRFDYEETTKNSLR